MIAIVKNNSTLQQTVKEALAKSNVVCPNFRQPIFIISAPRSGSTYLYELMQKMSGLVALDRENDPMWLNFFPYQRKAIPDDFITAAECNTTTAEAIKSYLLLKLIFKQHPTVTNKFYFDCLKQKPIIYLEKTIANCFHLEALETIFPDALYIYLIRDGRACVSSIIEGWQKGLGYKSPEILAVPKQAHIKYWCYPIPPQWQTVINQPLAKIGAWTWIEHNRYILEKMVKCDLFKQKTLIIKYESLITNPLNTIKNIASFTGLNLTEQCLNHLQTNNYSYTTISAPKLNKWRDKNPDLIREILPEIAPMMTTLGYQ